jgi:AmiR/NasT family two-component response regulator
MASPQPDLTISRLRSGSKPRIERVTTAEQVSYIVLRRFTEYRDLEGAFGRRAGTERAKGILMERHSVDDTGAFEMLRGNLPRAG